MAMIACKECGSQISSKAKNCPQCGVAVKSKSVVGKLILAFFLLPIVLVVIGGKSKPITPPVEAGSIGSGAAAAPEKAKTTTGLDDLALDFKPEKSGFGNIAMISGTINNTGPTAVKDVEIQCISSAASGTVLDKNKRTLYELVDAKKRHKFSQLNMGFINTQVQSVSCSVIGFKSP